MSLLIFFGGSGTVPATLTFTSAPASFSMVATGALRGTLAFASPPSTPAMAATGTLTGTLAVASASASFGFISTFVAGSSNAGTLAFASSAASQSLAATGTLCGTLAFASASATPAISTTVTLPATLAFVSAPASPAISALFGNASAVTVGFASAGAALSVHSAATLPVTLAFASAPATPAMNAVAAATNLTGTLTFASAPASAAHRATVTATTAEDVDPALTDCGDDLMARGMAWLASRQQSAMSQPIVYRRDTAAIAICATVGRTLFKLADEDGGIRMEWSDRDYLITTADLVLSGSATLPQRGDLIKQSVGGTLYTYEVLAPGGEPPWRWSDTYFNRVRVHTKLVNRGPAS